MKLRKLTKKDEFLKLNNLVNDKEVNDCIEENVINREPTYEVSVIRNGFVDIKGRLNELSTKELFLIKDQLESMIDDVLNAYQNRCQREQITNL